MGRSAGRSGKVSRTERHHSCRAGSQKVGGRNRRRFKFHRTVKLLVNSFLNAKRSRMDSGQLSMTLFQQYHEACKLIVDCFGRDSQVASLKPADLSTLLAKFPETWGLSMLGGNVGRIRSVFKFASAVYTAAVFCLTTPATTPEERNTWQQQQTPH